MKIIRCGVEYDLSPYKKLVNKGRKPEAAMKATWKDIRTDVSTKSKIIVEKNI